MTSAGLVRGSFGRSIHASLSISVAFVAQFFEITYKFMRSWMARCTARGAWALLLAVCSACASDPGGGDQDNGPAGGDGSGSGGAGRGGSAGTSGESSGGGEAGRGCAAANTPERLVDIHRLAGDLRVTRAGVFFLSAPMSALNRSQVRRLAENGTEDEIVYTATMGALTSLAVDETHLYVLERDVLVKAPITGGAPELVSAEDRSYDWNAMIVGVDAESVYMFTSEDANRLVRVSFADGSETTMAEHEGLAFHDIRIFDGHIWYKPNQGLDGVYKTPLDAADPSEAARVGMFTCVPFQMSVTPEGVFCSGAVEVRRYDLNGENPSAVWTLIGGGVDVSPPDSDTVYLVSAAGLPGSVLRALPIHGGAAADIACDRHTIREIGFDADNVFWIESQDEQSALYQLAK